MNVLSCCLPGRGLQWTEKSPESVIEAIRDSGRVCRHHRNVYCFLLFTVLLKTIATFFLLSIMLNAPTPGLLDTCFQPLAGRWSDFLLRKWMVMKGEKSRGKTRPPSLCRARTSPTFVSDPGTVRCTTSVDVARRLRGAVEHGSYPFKTGGEVVCVTRVGHPNEHIHWNASEEVPGTEDLYPKLRTGHEWPLITS